MLKHNAFITVITCTAYFFCLPAAANSDTASIIKQLHLAAADNKINRSEFANIEHFVENYTKACNKDHTSDLCKSPNATNIYNSLRSATEESQLKDIDSRITELNLSRDKKYDTSNISNLNNFFLGVNIQKDYSDDNPSFNNYSPYAEFDLYYSPFSIVDAPSPWILNLNFLFTGAPTCEAKETPEDTDSEAPSTAFLVASPAANNDTTSTESCEISDHIPTKFNEVTQNIEAMLSLGYNVLSSSQDSALILGVVAGAYTLESSLEEGSTAASFYGGRAVYHSLLGQSFKNRTSVTLAKYNHYLGADESANRFKVHSEVQIFDTAWNLGVLADFGLDKDKDGPSNIAVTFTRPLTQEFFSGLIK